MVLFAPVILAFQFFTRIPIPLSIAFEGETLRKGTLYLPFIGAVLGLLLFWFGLLVQGLWPAMVAAALTLACCIYLTGGLHLDGLLDTADGVYSQRQGDKMLTIITDSRIGAFGAIVGISMLILKFSLFYALFASQAYSAVIILPMLWSRFTLVVTIVTQPYYAGTTGLGSLYEGMGKSHIYHTFWQAILLSGCIYLITDLSIIIYLKIVCLLIASNLGVMYLVARQLKKQLGGLTGDIYGAINELCEIASLLVITAIVC